jgi:hypothetical protein
VQGTDGASEGMLMVFPEILAARELPADCASHRVQATYLGGTGSPCGG